MIHTLWYSHYREVSPQVHTPCAHPFIHSLWCTHCDILTVHTHRDTHTVIHTLWYIHCDTHTMIHTLWYVHHDTHTVVLTLQRGVSLCTYTMCTPHYTLTTTRIQINIQFAKRTTVFSRISIIVLNASIIWAILGSYITISISHLDWQTQSKLIWCNYLMHRPDAVAESVEHGYRMGVIVGSKPMFESNQWLTKLILIVS